MAIKLLIGGSPCTYWSIAQKNNRETEAEGLGWELFKNYLIAKEKFKPDFFLYENNKSAAKAIKEQISRELGVELMHINSALVSAQNRERFYVFNWDVEQPEDRGILLRDILETGEDLTSREKSYCLTASYDGAVAWNTLERAQRTMVAEPVAVDLQVVGRKRNENGEWERSYEARTDRKSSALTSVEGRRMVAAPIRIGTIESDAKNKEHDSKQYRVYSPDGKATTLCGQGGGVGAKTGLYATPLRVANIDSGSQGNRIYSSEAKSCAIKAQSGGLGGHGQGLYAMTLDKAQKRENTIYEVKDGSITIKGKQYPIKLADGFYIIRKLTVKECCRLQTMPDDYCRAVSNAQAYKGLGNGWTAEVIIHILNGALKDIPRDEEIIVLSMYDGIGTGRYCLDKMGFTNVKYYAYEIDKYAKQIAMSNYPDIIQCGGAFDLRNPDWTIGY